MITFAILGGWTGTCLSIIGALLLATRLSPPRLAYTVMLPGALLWLAVSSLDQNWALAAQSLTFSILNLIGIFRWGADAP